MDNLSGPDGDEADRQSSEQLVRAGTYYYDDGAIYDGEMRRGQRHGTGTHILHNKAMYKARIPRHAILSLVVCFAAPNVLTWWLVAIFR